MPIMDMKPQIRGKTGKQGGCGGIWCIWGVGGGARATKPRQDPVSKVHFILLITTIHLNCVIVRWPLHTGLAPTRKSYRDSCWQFGCQALSGFGWLKTMHSGL